MDWRRPLAIVWVAAGILLILAALICAKAYFIDALLGSIGKADKSMIFWAIPVLFIGIGFLAAGAALVMYGIRYLQKR